MNPPVAPSLSVIVPTYNCAPYVAAALDSLLQQTRPADEIIVVDDGSTDDTAAVLDAYAGQVTVLRQANQGVSVARNTGLAAAQGRYVALLDADDVSPPERLERQMAALTAAPGAVACFTGHYTFNERGREQEFAPNAEAADAAPLVQAARCLVFPPTLLFDRTRAPEVMYPPGVTCGEDILFVAQLRVRGSFVLLPQPLYGYRRRSGQATERHSVIDGFEQRRQWVEQHWRTPSGSEAGAVMWREFAATLRDFYWTRDRVRFDLVRQHLARHWPAGQTRPEELRWRWYPDWLWSLKERVSRLVR